MPQIFDNIELPLLPAIRDALAVSNRADFCVGYFNLRGWRQVASSIDRWSGGEGKCCRLLVGMNRMPDEELRLALSLSDDEEIDNQTALRIKKRAAEHFREQLVIGTPTNEDEAGLRRLATQLRAKKVVVRLFLRHSLHAKLYLTFRDDRINPTIGYLGSSNLTMSGLQQQGELNIDVLDRDACDKLARWFNDRWHDRWCIDISDELARIIDESWARETPIPPYHIYVNIAYHLSQEARLGLAEFRIPPEFGNRLFEFQKAAVKIAARHLNTRGGVIIGDVVGLGKTLMATALARIFEEDFLFETLIICPKNLVGMWEGYRDRYRLHAKIVPLSVVGRELPRLPRYRLLLIDESHNLRNRDGQRYRAIQDYVRRNDSKCILLSATPYNKSYLDLANQLRLFLPEDRDVGVRPEALLGSIGEVAFIQRHQCGVRTLAAFEKSGFADDWRELMRLFLVRRTRSFIQDNYAETDPLTGRKFLTFEDGRRSYFPLRIPKTIRFPIDPADPSDQYARLFADTVVDDINRLTLPRYGLANYLHRKPPESPTDAEQRSFTDLSRAGRRLMGFCRTNLFKRLESSGHAFLLSVERHLLRNYVYLHALATGLPVPIGTQDAALLDPRADADDEFPDDEQDDSDAPDETAPGPLTEDEFQACAAAVYGTYADQFKKRFKWIRPSFFTRDLARDLKKDNQLLLGVLAASGTWDVKGDRKFAALVDLVTKSHAGAKVLVFSQFADTVRYLDVELRRSGVKCVGAATGDAPDPTSLAKRFSPVSNECRADVTPERELNVLLATDVLSEGQNLQDGAIVVNYDLPWAIIRLIQRAGRVDRIGQKADTICCYSFLPADGVERIIRLRTRVRQRLQENAEVVGTDEAFFEDDANPQSIRDLYNEKAEVLNADADGEVDLASYAYQIWKNAITADPSLQKTIPELRPVVYGAKTHTPTTREPAGVLVYTRTTEGNDALAWVGDDGKSVTESQFAILRAAACEPDTPSATRSNDHHSLVRKAVEMLSAEGRVVGGQLGRPSGARFRIYERLQAHLESLRGTLMDSASGPLKRAVEEIFRYPLTAAAVDTLNRQLRAGASDIDLAELVVGLREQDRLCIVEEEVRRQDARIICSLGLVGPTPGN